MEEKQIIYEEEHNDYGDEDSEEEDLREERTPMFDMNFNIGFDYIDDAINGIFGGN